MFIKTFGELCKDMFEECGGKAAHLGELTGLGLKVPSGYTVLGSAYYRHLEANRLMDRISVISATIDFDNYENIERKTAEIRESIIAAPVPEEIEKEIVDNYVALAGDGDPFVAVRSSVAMKDSSISSFPGMMDTYHYIRGAKNVVLKVRECWASLWSARAAVTRHNKSLDDTKAVIAPTIQLMVNSEMAGVLFTINPVTGSKDEFMIESNWGLGETVVSGRCTSDLYIVSKNPVAIVTGTIATKSETYIQNEGGGAKWVSVDAAKAVLPTLNESQVKELCTIAAGIEAHYGVPQDIEWAYEKGVFYILQARKARACGG